MVRQDPHERTLPCDAPRLVHFFLGNDKRDHAHPRKLVALLYGRVVAPRGNHDFIQGVDFVKAFDVDFKQAVAIGGQLDFALLDGRFVHVIIFAQAAQDARTVVFVEHPCLLLPDIDVILAHGEQHRDILLGDNMALAKPRVLCDTFDDLCHIMAEHLSDRVLRPDLFHPPSLFQSVVFLKIVRKIILP